MSENPKSYQKKPEQDFKKGEPNPKFKPDMNRNKVVIFVLIIVTLLIIIQFFLFPEIVVKRLTYSEFYNIVARNRETGKIVSCELVENQIRGKFHSGTYFQVNVPPGDLELIPMLRENVSDFTVNPPQVFWRNVLYSILPVLFLMSA